MVDFGSPFLTIHGVADLLQLHPMTIYRMAKKKELPLIKVGGKWRTKKEWVERFLEKKAELQPV